MQQFRKPFCKPFWLAPRVFVFLGCFFSGIEASAQSLPINFLFRPTGWVGYEHIGPAKLDKSSVSLPSPYAGLTVPLYSSVAIKREPFDMHAHQIMGQFYSRYQQSVFTGIPDSIHESGHISQRRSTSYVFSGGFMGVKAGLNGGMWVYGARGTISMAKGALGEQNNSLLAAVARVHVKHLHKGFMYGLGFFASKDIVVPIPAFAYYYKPYREITLYAIFPVQVKASYQITPKLNLAYVSTISTRPTMVALKTDEGEDRYARLSSLGLRHGLMAQISPNKTIDIFLEGGFMLPQQVSIADKQEVSFFARPTWYLDISFMRSYGDKLIDSPLGGF